MRLSRPGSALTVVNGRPSPSKIRTGASAHPRGSYCVKEVQKEVSILVVSEFEEGGVFCCRFSSGACKTLPRLQRVRRRFSQIPNVGWAVHWSVDNATQDSEGL